MDGLPQCIAKRPAKQGQGEQQRVQGNMRQRCEGMNEPRRVVGGRELAQPNANHDANKEKNKYEQSEMAMPLEEPLLHDTSVNLIANQDQGCRETQAKYGEPV